MSDRKVEIYQTPLRVDDPADCYFYHVMDLPGLGLVGGQWDLRETVDAYLGGFDFNGKRVLDVGTASGFVTFEMEKRGADVVSVDLARGRDWDVVPFVSDEFDLAKEIEIREKHLAMLHNGYWLAHRLYNSRAKVYYGNVYDLPDALGAFDVVFIGATLLHLRDPFLGLKSAARLSKNALIITDLTYRADGPVMMFVPDLDRLEPRDTWWRISEGMFMQMMRVLGFDDITVARANYKINHRPDREFMECSTFVGRRRSE